MREALQIILPIGHTSYKKHDALLVNSIKTHNAVSLEVWTEKYTRKTWTETEELI